MKRQAFNPKAHRALTKTARTMLLAMVTTVIASTAVRAQESVASWPTRPVRVLLGYPPGSGADLVPRIAGEHLRTKWGQPVVVENRPGASGHIASEAVFKSAPDGYTLLAVPPAFATTPHMFASLPFDPDAFVPVTIMAAQANVLVAAPGRIPEVKSFADLVSHARANPGKLFYGSPGNGGSSHLSAELFKMLAGNLAITHVPYKGQAVLAATLANEVDFSLFTLGATLPNIRTGRLRPLAVGGDQRFAGLPDVPAMREVVPGLASATWFALLAPPRTPPDLVAKIQAGFAEALRTPDAQKKLADLTADVIANTPAEAAAFIAEEKARWGKVIRAAKITAD